MNILMIMLSGVVLVNNQNPVDVGQFEQITGQKVVRQGIVPVVAKNDTTQLNVKSKKITKKKHNIKSKNVKKVQKSKKYKSKKKVYRKKFNIKYNKGEIQSYTHSLVISYGWSEYDWGCLVKLWNRESSWNPNAVNKKSGACGLGQAYPCSKATKGTDYRNNWKTQVRWGLRYIANRYGNPANAWEHSQQTGWY